MYKAKLKKAHHDWLAAKHEASMRLRRAGREDVARQLDECTLFTGDETLEEVCELMFAPQAIEFCLSFDFPDDISLAILADMGVEKNGIYIDAGAIELTNPLKVMLVGDTHARLLYDDVHGGLVVARGGATADVVARHYSVVRCEHDRISIIDTHTYDHAIVL